jgi:hypothetical protein
MKRIALALLFACTFVMPSLAQQKFKPWTEWSLKEAEKVLNDSPWGRTQIDMDLAEQFFAPTSNAVTDSRRIEQGAVNQAVPVRFRIRFLSAKPIRQALARTLELQQKNADSELVKRLHAFANADSDDWIFVAVTFDSTDKRFMASVMQAFSGVNTGTIKNKTYLERTDGKRLFLHEYVAPGKDGIGAKFAFPRLVDGKPFLTEGAGEVRFYSEFSDKMKLSMRFKVASMVYDGRLEY